MTKILLIITLLAVISTAHSAAPGHAGPRFVRQVQQEMINQENNTHGLSLNEVTNTLVQETRGLGKLILDFIRNLGTSMRESYSNRQTRSVHDDPVEVVLVQVHEAAKNISQMSPDELHKRVRRAAFDFFNLFNWVGSDDEMNTEFQRLAEENGNKTEEAETDTTDDVTESSSFKLFKRSADDAVPTYDPASTTTTSSTTIKSTTPKSSSGGSIGGSIGDILPSSLNGLLMQSPLGSLFSGAFDSDKNQQNEGSNEKPSTNKPSSSDNDNNNNKKPSSPTTLSVGSSSEVLSAAGVPSAVTSLIKNIKFPASLVGSKGLPGLPGLPGAPGIVGAVPGLNALRAMIVVKVGTLLALLKAVFILSCLKTAGLLALLLGLVIPIYGKWKKAGVVLPVAADAPYSAGRGYADDYAMEHITNGYNKYQ